MTKEVMKQVIQVLKKLVVGSKYEDALEAEEIIKSIEEALKQSKPLTDEEIRKFQHHVVSGAYQHSFIQGVRYAESAHGIKE